MEILKALLGQGMARQAGENLSNHPAYQKYAIEMQVNGLEPLPFEEWVKANQRMSMRGPVVMK
jgi:hypothetical protein